MTFLCISLLSFSDDDFCLVTTIHKISSCRKETIMTHPSHDSLPKLTTAEGVFPLSLSCSQGHAAIDDCHHPHRWLQSHHQWRSIHLTIRLSRLQVLCICQQFNWHYWIVSC
jgi:hypothetical protein